MQVWRPMGEFERRAMLLTCSVAETEEALWIDNTAPPLIRPLASAVVAAPADLYKPRMLRRNGDGTETF